MEKSISLVIGRFEPIHKGHEKLVNIALSKSDIVLIFVIDSNKCLMPIDFRIELINIIYKKEVFEKRIVIKKFKPIDEINLKYGDFVINEVNKILNKSPNYIIFGNDKKVENCFNKKYIDKIEFIKVDRNIIKISGTKLRKAIKNNDKYYKKFALNKKLIRYTNKIYKFID